MLSFKKSPMAFGLSGGKELFAAVCSVVNPCQRQGLSVLQSISTVSSGMYLQKWGSGNITAID